MFCLGWPFTSVYQSETVDCRRRYCTVFVTRFAPQFPTCLNTTGSLPALGAFGSPVANGEEEDQGFDQGDGGFRAPVAGARRQPLVPGRDGSRSRLVRICAENS